MTIVNNWRAAHMYPAHVFYVLLRQKAKKADSSAFAVQRNKRLQSILSKLSREPQMKLTQMQDIAGCRAVLKNMRQVEQLREALQASWKKHEQIPAKDYVTEPKVDGYRCLHLRYRFSATGQKQAFGGLKVEVQIRTLRQHRWATAVEVVDTFTKQALKSSAGRPEWARFFVLMSSVYARLEGCPLPPGISETPGDVIDELKSLDATYKFVSTLGAIAIATKHVESSSGPVSTYLVVLDLASRVTRITGFTSQHQELAQQMYERAERDGAEGQKQAVLISATSFKQLRRAYPNYFLDVGDFLFDVETTLL